MTLKMYLLFLVLISIPLINSHNGRLLCIGLRGKCKRNRSTLRFGTVVCSLAERSPSRTMVRANRSGSNQSALHSGAIHIAFVPFGFVSNHVEVLYDNDVECKQLVENGGAMYLRAQMPNCNETFLQAMASAIVERIHS